MNIDNMRLWVAALRSGLYEQGREYLHESTDDDHTYCALGVACEVADLRVEEDVKWTRDTIIYKYGAEMHDMMAPIELAEWLGIPYQYYLPDRCGDVQVTDDQGHVRYVSYLNDAGKSFDQIADLIESTYGL